MSFRRLPTPTQPAVFFRNREGREFDLIPDTIHKYSKRYKVTYRERQLKVLVRRLDQFWVRVIFVDPPEGHVEIRARSGCGMTIRESVEIAAELVFE